MYKKGDLFPAKTMRWHKYFLDKKIERLTDVL